MISDVIKNSKAYQYAIECVNPNNKNVGKYVKKQCQIFLDSLDEDSDYYIDEGEFDALCKFLKIINIMPNKNAYDNLASFQWFFITNVLCMRRKSNNKKKYELSIMLIARKQGRQNNVKCFNFLTTYVISRS